MLIKDIIDELNADETLTKERSAIIAFSGGPDSVFAVEIFRNFFKDYKIYLYHLNHMIRDEAIHDENFVKKYAEENGIELFLNSCDIPKFSKEHSIGLEEAGRIVRYKDLEELSKNTKVNTIVTGHHLNDDIETFILNFKRGSGLNGYSSIKKRDGKYLRPLLGVTKRQILDYLNDREIEFCIDRTNFIDDTNRNKIRLNVIPELEKLDEKLYDDFGRFLNSMKEEMSLKNSLVTGFVFEHNLSKTSDELCFKIEDVKRYFGDDFSALYMEAIKILRGNTVDIYKKALDSILNIIDGEEEKRTSVGGVVAIKSYENLIFRRDIENDGRKIYLSIETTENTIGFIKTDSNIENLKIRNREAGDEVKFKNRPTKLLKKFLIEEKVPAYKRDDLIIVTDDENILYVEGFGPTINGIEGKNKIYINERKKDE